MEILIIGVIIVALMVYASTKIKKFSANAFERETVEMEEFSLVKPEGFLHVIDDESEFAFYAYSKEFGNADAEEIRRAEIFIKSFSGKTAKQICKGIKTQAGKIVYEEFSDDGKICLLDVEKTVRKIEVCEFYKLIEKGKVFQIKIKVLKDFQDEYKERIETIFDSFRVK